jgi:hypothetical protein
MYEMARQRIADQQRVAEQWRTAQAAGKARSRRAIARWRRGKAAQAEEIATPVIPDFAAEMFEAAQDTLPAPREEEAGGRAARSGR